MRDAFRLRRGAAGFWLLAPLVALALGGCIEDDIGYQRVPNRTRDPLPAPAAPEPPPLTASARAGAGGGGQVVAANLPAGVTQEMVDEGQKQFQLCSACHGPGGAGTGAGPALNDAEWIHISGNFEEIVNVIHSGVSAPREFPGGMPPLGGGNFTEEQVRQIAAYVYALSQQGGS